MIDDRRLRELGIEMERDVALAPFTTIKIGGPADFFTIVTNLDQFQALVRWARSVELPYFVLGGGSNILIGDAGIRGLVVYNRCRHIAFGQRTAGEKDTGASILLHAESGVATAGMARQAVKRGLAGLEWAVSLPGTVGGAVVGNAGAHGAEVKDNLVEAHIISDDGSMIAMTVDDLTYGYRSSSLKRLSPLQAGFNPVILSACFRLYVDKAGEVRAKADSYLAHRRRTQPVEPSLGSTFANPPGDFAGRLIEEAGLKGLRVGGVQVSSVHANFIINSGGPGHARAADFAELVRRIQAEVHRRFAVDLVPEIQLAGEW
jgi:UDP-N-acetylmuramate dehydrogenase